MKRIVMIEWKNASDRPIQIFSNLKILCESYPAYNYNTVNNYLSKKRTVFENDEIKIQRKMVHTTPVAVRNIVMTVKKVGMHNHDEELQNVEYWLSRPVEERLQAVTRLSAQLKKHKDERMNKSVYKKIKR